MNAPPVDESTGDAPPVDAPPFDMTGAVVETMAGLVDSVASLARMEASIAAYKAELIVAAGEWALLAEDPDDGTCSGWSPRARAHRTVVTELAAALRLPERSVERLVADSGTLFARLPTTLTALREGLISWRHAQVITDQVSFIPDDAIPGFETAAVPFAQILTVAKFERKARIMRERLHPESIADRHREAIKDREVTLSPGADGMAWLNAHLPAVDAHAIFARVTDIAIAHKAPGEDRTLTQLRADAFTALLIDGVVAEPAGTDADADVNAGADGGTGGVAASGTRGRVSDRGIRPTVSITVPVLSLLGRIDEPATLDGYGPIDMDTATRLVADAPSLIRILTHPETGAVLSVGRDRYAVPADLRAWLRVRDGTCRFPGCSRPARLCDLDHTVDWAKGGATDHDNLAHLCPDHHHVKHRTDWRMDQLADGVSRWTSPAGKTYLTYPDTAITVR